jgi:hypothetical protein
MADASFTFTRPGTGLGTMVISSDVSDYYVLESFTRPGLRPVNSYASSGLVHGDVLVRSRLEAANIGITFYVTGATTNIVENRVDAAEACFAQFTYAVTMDIDGHARGYACDPSSVDAGPVEAGLVDAHLCLMSVNLSIYPLASS